MGGERKGKGKRGKNEDARGMMEEWEEGKEHGCVEGIRREGSMKERMWKEREEGREGDKEGEREVRRERYR